MPVSEQLNPIACELCRIKKSKCDRNRPACSQCRSKLATCSYPQSNKRGIPSGYIASLEKRLLETETALFESLSFIETSSHGSAGHQMNASHIDALAQTSKSQSKEEKIDEWQSFPLNSSEQRDAWLQEKRRIAAGGEEIEDSPGGPALRISFDASPNSIGGHSNSYVGESGRGMNKEVGNDYLAPWQVSGGEEVAFQNSDRAHGLRYPQGSQILLDEQSDRHQNITADRVLSPIQSSPPESLEKRPSSTLGDDIYNQPPSERSRFTSKQWEKYF